MPIKKEVIEGVKSICDAHKDEPSPLMMILSDIQKKYGYKTVKKKHYVWYENIN